MREHPTLRLVSALTIAAILSASMLASTALAALPNIVTGGGAVTTCDPSAAVSGAVPANVTPSTPSTPSVAGFRIWAKNCDTSTQQALTLTVVSRDSNQPVPPVYGVKFSTGSCDPGTVLHCSFGTFVPQQEIFVTVAFVAPQNAETLRLDFQWKTTGQGPDPNGRSHGDTVHWLDQVVITSDANYSGHFAFDSSLLLVGNGASLGNNNKQSTAVDANSLSGELGTGTGQGIPLTVKDGPNIPEGCVDTVVPAFTCPTTFADETSVINVGSNALFDNYFKVTITIYKGPNPNQLGGIYHGYNDSAGVFHQELIIATFPPGGTPTVFPSYSAEKVGGNLVLVIVMYHNGMIRHY